jgi:hypothetical protein
LTIQGRAQEIHHTPNSIIAILHLLPSTSSEIGSLREHNDREARAKRRDGISTKESEDTSPTTLIIKAFEDEPPFLNEVEAYRRMLSIQGTLVPAFYGSNPNIAIPDTSSPEDIEILPCIIIEHIIGENLFDHKISHRSKLPQLAKAVEDCCMKIADTGVAQMDPQLEGIVVVKPDGFEVKMIDFSHVGFEPFYLVGMSRGNSYFLMRRYVEVLGWTMPMDVTSWGKDKPGENDSET